MADKTGITKSGHFLAKKIIVNFFRSPVIYIYAKRIMVISPLVCPQLLFKITKKS